MMEDNFTQYYFTKVYVKFKTVTNIFNLIVKYCRFSFNPKFIFLSDKNVSAYQNTAPYSI